MVWPKHFGTICIQKGFVLCFFCAKHWINQSCFWIYGGIQLSILAPFSALKQDHSLVRWWWILLSAPYTVRGINDIRRWDTVHGGRSFKASGKTSDVTHTVLVHFFMYFTVLDVCVCLCVSAVVIVHCVLLFFVLFFTVLLLYVFWCQVTNMTGSFPFWAAS